MMSEDIIIILSQKTKSRKIIFITSFSCSFSSLLIFFNEVPYLFKNFFSWVSKIQNILGLYKMNKFYLHHVQMIVKKLFPLSSAILGVIIRNSVQIWFMRSTIEMCHHVDSSSCLCIHLLLWCTKNLRFYLATTIPRQVCY